MGEAQVNVELVPRFVRVEPGYIVVDMEGEKRVQMVVAEGEEMGVFERNRVSVRMGNGLRF